MKLFLCSMIFFGSIVSALAQKNNAPNTFILDAKMLEVAKKRINKNDETVMPAYQQLIKNADKALKLSPFTVTAKKDPAPATDIHDYVSIAPYWFPDPTKPDGLPYIRKDGERNPEVSNYPDKEALPKMTSAVESLALAYYFSEDEKYADKAATLIRVFFLDAATRMNPNLNYAQAIKGRNDGRGAGIIESRHFVKVIDGIGLIQKSKSWTSKDQAGIEKWFADMLDWMQTSKNGIDELNAKNNHGVFYDMQRMSFALLTKNTDLQKEIIENVTSRLDNQQADDGSFPAELERTIGLHYSTFVLKAFYALAFMAEQIHVDLWNYTSPSGKSLKKATEFWYPYATNQAEWKWQQINPYEYENECIDVLKIASIKYNDDKYVKNIDKLIDASVVKKHLSNLIVGMDLR